MRKIRSTDKGAFRVLRVSAMPASGRMAGASAREVVVASGQVGTLKFGRYGDPMHDQPATFQQALDDSLKAL